MTLCFHVFYPMGNNINIASQPDNSTTSSSANLPVVSHTASSSVPPARIPDSDRGPRSSANPSVSLRDENFNYSVKLQSNPEVPTSAALSGTVGIVPPIPVIPTSDLQKHGAEPTFRSTPSHMAGFPPGSISHTKEGIVMTPVTASPTHHTSVSPPQVTSVVTYTPFFGAYQAPITVPGYQSYIPINSPSVARLPAVESYSAMLASMGNQLQLAQAQGQIRPGSYLPSGYITLSGQYTHMPPVLIPTSQIPNREGTQTLSINESSGVHLPPGAPPLRYTSQEHRLPSGAQYRSQERGHLSSERKEPSTSSLSIDLIKSTEQGHSHVDVRRHLMQTGDIQGHGMRPHVSGVHEPIFPRSSETLQRSYSDEQKRQVFNSLDLVLGKTSMPQPVASAPGGIKIELPPPTIGMHIGTKPPQLAPLNTAIVPPLLPLTHIRSDLEHGAKLVPSSSSAPLPSFGLSSSIRPLSSHMLSTGPHQSASHILPALFENKVLLSSEEGTRHIPISSSSHVSRSLSSHMSQSPSSHSSIFQHSPIAHQVHLVDRKKETDPGVTHLSWSKDVSSTVHDHKSVPKPPDVEFMAGPRTRDADHSQVQSSRPILTSQPPPVANVPSYFTRGSIIQLASGHLKRVEELQTEDFINSAQLTDGLKIDSSTVSRIEQDLERGVALISFLVGEHKAQVTVEARVDHPFFVYGQGWSSVCPPNSQKCYSLNCHALSVGDVCVSLTVVERKDAPSRPEDNPASQTVERRTNEFAEHRGHHSVEGIKGPSYLESRSVSFSDQEHFSESKGPPPMAAVRESEGMQSPERKRQRFHECRTASFEESMDALPLGTVKAEPQKMDLSQRGRDNLEAKSFIEQVSSHQVSSGREVTKDQNQNLISNPASRLHQQPPQQLFHASESAPVSGSSPPRWFQPPKRRWSDPIKSCEENAEREVLPNAPHPATLSKLTEEH